MSDASSFSDWQRNDTKVVFNEPGAMILERKDGQRQLVKSGEPWSDHHTQLAQEYKATSLSISESSFGNRTNADFLLKVRPFRQLHIVLGKPKDLVSIAQLTELEYLGILGEVVSPNVGSVPAIDFAPLQNLKVANIQLCTLTQSILNVESLESLTLWSRFDPPLDLLLKKNGARSFRDWQKQQEVTVDLSKLTRLRSLHLAACPQVHDLDLTHQSELSELEFDVLPKLKSVSLHPKVRIRKLKFNRCGAYRIDWKRIGPDLEELELVGPLKFDFEDISHARNLRKLRTNGIRKFPNLGFLLDLPNLAEFDLWPPGAVAKLPDDDRAVIEAINERSRSAG